MPTLNGFTGPNELPTPAAPQAHRHHGQRIEADAARQQQQYRYERDDLLPHALHRPSGGEHDGHDGDDEFRAVGETTGQPVDALPERAGRVDDAERAADQEDQKDHRAGVGHAFRNGHQRGERPDGSGLYWVKRSRDDDVPASDGVLTPFVLTGRKDVAECSGEDDTSEQECKRVWDARRGQGASR
jgi:hypothetical protein